MLWTLFMGWLWKVYIKSGHLLQKWNFSAMGTCTNSSCIRGKNTSEDLELLSEDTVDKWVYMLDGSLSIDALVLG